MEVTSQSSELKYFRFLLVLNTQKYIYFNNVPKIGKIMTSSENG